MKYSILCGLAALLLIPRLSFSAENEAVDETEDMEAVLIEPSAMSPSSAMDTSPSEFVGNPTASLMSWWPEDLVIAPIPGRSPEFGWNLALMAAYFADLDKAHPDTPSSIISGFGWFAENGSWAGGAAGKFNFLDDKVRGSLAAAYADINYRFYGVGNGAGEAGVSARVDQQLPLYFGSVSYQFFPNTYFGIGYLASSVETGLRLDLLPPEWDVPTVDFDLKIAAVVVPFEYDTRDNEQFPRDGWHVSGRAMLYRDAVGSDVDTNIFQIAANRYLPMRERDVLALRVMTRASGEDAPFFLLSTFGGRTDLRGYESGRYRDRMMYAAQAEYRWQPLDRWIFTGFAGVGEVAPSYSDFFDNFLPAAGAGARFVLSPKHRLNFSVDVAVGKHGAEFYVGVGESF
jgi:hypothetical protein